MQPKLSKNCNSEEIIGDRPFGSPCSSIDRDSPVDFDDSETESLIEKINSKIENHEKFFSLEFFPPRTKEGAVNLLARYFPLYFLLDLLIVYGVYFHCIFFLSPLFHDELFRISTAFRNRNCNFD